MLGFQPAQRASEGNAVGAKRALSGSFLRLPDYSGKRFFDICFAVLALLLLSPVLFAIAVAVKATSPGPVLYRQLRYGRRSELFTIFKFRTMRTCEATRQTMQTQEADPRFTCLGAFLRRTSLDELPQFLNVLIGNMSVVGPRPHAPLTMIGNVPYEDVARDYGSRHAARPGITGLAQISGFRGPIKDIDSARRRFEIDLDYIAKPSFKADVIIIWRSFVSEFVTGSGL
jgi:lipopolysaccharide/colanic/teichoic acid biosynthesis glycosyltransferase